MPADLLGWTKFLLHQGTTATIEEQTEWERDGVLASVGSDFMVARLNEFLTTWGLRVPTLLTPRLAPAVVRVAPRKHGGSNVWQHR